eukprot:gene13165-9011_t
MPLNLIWVLCVMVAFCLPACGRFIKVWVTLSFEDIIVLHVAFYFYYNRLDFRDLRFRCGQFFVGEVLYYDKFYGVALDIASVCVAPCGLVVSYVISCVDCNGLHVVPRGCCVFNVHYLVLSLLNEGPVTGYLVVIRSFGLLAFNCKYVLQLIGADILLIDFVCFDMLWFDSQFALPVFEFVLLCLQGRNLVYVRGPLDVPNVRQYVVLSTGVYIVCCCSEVGCISVLHYGMYFMLVISYWGCLCYLGLARACVDVFWVVAFFCSNDLCSFLTTLLGFHSDWLLLLLLNIVDTPFFADVSVFGLEVDAFVFCVCAQGFIWVFTLCCDATAVICLKLVWFTCGKRLK